CKLLSRVITSAARQSTRHLGSSAINAKCSNLQPPQRPQVVHLGCEQQRLRSPLHRRTRVRPGTPMPLFQTSGQCPLDAGDKKSPALALDGSSCFSELALVLVAS